MPTANDAIVDLHNRAVESQGVETCDKHGCKMEAAEMTGAGPLYVCPTCEDEQMEAFDKWYWKHHHSDGTKKEVL